MVSAAPPSYIRCFVHHCHAFGINQATTNPFIKETISPVWLSQNNASTIISALLLGIRIIALSWTTISTWRCAMILMETSGLSLHDLSFFVSYSIIVPRFQTRTNRETRFFWISVFLSVLLLPIQISAPIATGSVSWVPTIVHDKGTNDIGDISIPSEGYFYVWYNLYPSDRDVSVLRVLFTSFSLFQKE